MTVFANYTYGHDIANKAYQDYLYYSSKTATRTLKDGLNYWTPDNTNTDIPRPNQYGRSLRGLESRYFELYGAKRRLYQDTGI